jgi:hypothetical protein
LYRKWALENWWSAQIMVTNLQIYNEGMTLSINGQELC